MEIEFLPIKNDFGEISSGHKCFFDSKYMSEIDAISATANVGGFTPLTSLARWAGWESKFIIDLSERVNSKREIGIADKVDPVLLLIPHTDGQSDQTSLIADLFAALNFLQIKKLRFSHYGFLQSKFPEIEIRGILHTLRMKENLLSITKIYWDIDKRFENEMRILYKEFI